MRSLFVVRSVGSASAVLVIGRDGRIVIARNAGNRPLAEQIHHLVRPGGVAGEITEMVDRVHVRPLANVGEGGLQRGKICVNVGDQCESLHCRARAAAPTRRVITPAVSGHAPWNSADAFTTSGTAARVVCVKPKRGKYFSPVSVRRWSSSL